MPPAADPATPLEPAPGETWWVAHVRPRCEKKFGRLLEAEGLAHYLPVLETVRRYGSRTRRSSRPLFPGYVFLRLAPAGQTRVYQQDLLARLLPVSDEPTFLRQLEEVRRVVRQGLAVALSPLLRQGVRVRVVAGPLAGLEGRVEDPARDDGIVLAVDVLQQGLRVRVPTEHLQVLP